ncbi:DNA polymerase III subunit delta [Marihabitans asiaticum]|uniref:DNA polymerase III subunit delta n=1 Tax=Marihabitans asiaticum TaxID=415218 RepID=A0A560WA97_9MICO|nr:DNA polymerase III subunit delta [Marihabitans asiaticum]TWD14553.1 DNA polymerase III delta subunit [Marihabitans asiaticum]
MTESVDVPSRVPPLVLVSGPEDLLAERAVDSLLQDLRVSSPEVDVIDVEPAGYEAGALGVHVSPSLFGEDKAVVVHGLHEATDALQQDLLDYLADPVEHVTLVVLHGSGNRGKRVLDTLKKSRARVIDCPAVKSDRDKADFVTGEFRRARRKITQDAVQALVEAVGKDLRELASACTQLVDDTTGTIDADVVERYHGGKVEATGFRVADAAVAGEAGEALRLLRHAVAVGVDPVPIVAVLAGQLRQLAKVGGAGRGRSTDLARELGMAPWQVDKARRALNGWSGPGLATAIQAVAAADEEVKGGGRDPVYAVERAILTITRTHGSG